MDKKALVKALAKRVDVSEREATDATDGLVAIIGDELINGNTVMVRGFGKFELNTKKSRKGRNPRTGEELIIPETTTVRFKVAERLKSKLNRGKK